MSSADEAMAAKGQLAAGLEAGLDTLSLGQVVTFTKYVRLVLPMDGYVFWVRADLVANQITGACAAGAETISVKGSMHFVTDQAQREDETFGVNHMVFTALEPVDEFNTIQPGTMYLGEFEGLQFSFARRNSFYKQADLHHYVGDAVYPAMRSQIIDCADDLGAAGLVVSNSLPMWLALNTLLQPYPSYLVGENIEPPYAAIHIDPDGTQVFSAAPVIDQNSNHWQLAKDRVRVTLYGLNNSGALAYLDSVLDFMANGDSMGLMNMPTVRDAKRVQSELTVLAMKKTIEFEVSYYQQAARDVARQLILHCIPTYVIGD